MLKGKQIVVGVSGGIAAYKSCELVSRLVKQGAQVDVVMTEAATSFVHPQTFQALSRNVVVTSLFQSIKHWEIEHISLSQKADLIVIAPATANIIGKIAGGIADDFLTTAVMASTAPVVFAPAMNTKMYENPIFQKNMKTLQQVGYQFIDPCEGLLACGDTGTGKMAEPSQIEGYILDHFRRNQTLKDVNVLITAGPTMEPIDPVRYISNHSSGKMGFALAKAALLCGAKVTLVAGPVHLEPPAGCTYHSVKTTKEMHEIVLQLFDQQQVVIKAAAVADYRPAEMAMQKIKKNQTDLTIQMVKNPDILLELGKKKTHQILVGFAAETEQVAAYAADKMKRKRLDLMVANDVSREGAGFQHDTNEVILMKPSGEMKEIPLASKEIIAQEIISEIVTILNRK
ncbi:bifunctional phosphopantothenoylcysteine decarboxylase/phosphopantothenate--cysteine ligase CoaBC [Anoxynatronum buryatiense]|uniref:Coenzyme A biosynthesis bifunctional protein CoaBC n=1 Tax=Anoxynatronum buryatiense TaxID=489973 RepID=A0AA45WUK4_9CLOT|nr:bifunctional phosphopantothenoylcysteine decarboxylase/phosphopantothenate--cysteine ligase CoaBC [Anoxynatronum buryatiense]SMP46865.1 phosphopantothenoylcysteine decarboxylase / phosphopantothenate--cysteine ligase [Anoxynatronum buryatiense]